MIQTYGQGRTTTLMRRLNHHAPALTGLAGYLMNGLLASKVARDDRIHKLHIGKGAGGVNLHLDNGAKFAFRGGFDAEGDYETVEILDATKNGSVLMVVRSPDDVPTAIERIEQEL